MSEQWKNWNQQIIDEFRANDGKVGGQFAGANLLILRTIGAKSGQLRESPVAYFADDDGSMVVVASKAGLPTNPAWYHNLKANPKFDVEVGTADAPRHRRGDHRLRVRGEVGRDRRQGAGVRRVPGEDDARDPAGASHPSGVAGRTSSDPA